MTDREKINRALSGLKASEDTIQEVIKMAENTNHRRNTGRRIVTIALAACLIFALSITVCAAAGIINVGSEMSKHDFFHNAFGTGIEGRDAFTVTVGDVTDKDGNVLYEKTEFYPAVERVDVDFERAEELVGDYVVAINKSYTTADGDEIILRDFVMDENGIGILSYEVKGENAKNHFGWITLYDGDTDDVWMDMDDITVSEGEDSHVLMAYITPFHEFDPQKLQVEFRGYNKHDDRARLKLDIENYVPSRSFEANGVTVEVSPMGMLFKSKTGNYDSWVGGEIIHFKDGSEYVLQGETVHNISVSSLLHNGDIAVAFNRLVDVDEIESISFNAMY